LKGARLDEPQQRVTFKTRQANSCAPVLPVLLRVTDPRSVPKRSASNIEHRTSNAEWDGASLSFDVRRSVFSVRCYPFFSKKKPLPGGPAGVEQN
jgi:hypothetical protein